LTFVVYIVYLYYMKPLKITQSITNRESQSFEKYLSDVSKKEMISPEREIELARLIKSGNEKAMQELVTANLRFVISVAKQYSGRGMSVEDLVSEGNIGLIKAANKWDESRGIKFISYAVWWVRQSILQSLADNSRSIRLPLNQINSLNKIKSSVNQLEQVLDRTPSAIELSEFLNIDLDKIETTLDCQKKIVSLDTPIGDEDELCLLDTISSESKTDDLINHSDLTKTLLGEISKLTEKEQFVIKSTFGFDSEVKTTSEIAIHLGLSDERVRQIKKSGLKKLSNTKVNL
jgi:RNA polymerase primary sigma factor